VNAERTPAVPGPAEPDEAVPTLADALVDILTGRDPVSRYVTDTDTSAIHLVMTVDAEGRTEMLAALEHAGLAVTPTDRYELIAHGSDQPEKALYVISHPPARHRGIAVASILDRWDAAYRRGEDPLDWHGGTGGGGWATTLPEVWAAREDAAWWRSAVFRRLLSEVRTELRTGPYGSDPQAASPAIDVHAVLLVDLPDSVRHSHDSVRRIAVSALAHMSLLTTAQTLEQPLEETLEQPSEQPRPLVLAPAKARASDSPGGRERADLP
jgi:hypothetical protein